MTSKQMRTLLKSQQGELDAVKMYLKLASHAPNEEVARVFKQLAAEEGHHGAVFHQLTQKELKPKAAKAFFVNCMSYIVGWKILFKLVAQGEYSAYNKYESVVADFETVASVRMDEKRHGDMVLALRDTL